MFVMANVVTKNGEEKIGFNTMAIIIRIARSDGWNPKGENPLVCDREDSRALKKALEKSLKRLQAFIKDSEDPNCEIPSTLLVTQMHLAELVEWFLCLTRGEAFKIQLGERQEYKGSKPRRMTN